MLTDWLVMGAGQDATPSVLSAVSVHLDQHQTKKINFYMSFCKSILLYWYSFILTSS